MPAIAMPQGTPTPAVCGVCGEDADFREDGEPLDDGKHEPDGQAIYCVGCFAKLPSGEALYRGMY